MEVVHPADRWLRHLRFGQNRAELTTKGYAGDAALYLTWCVRTGRQWPEAAQDLGLFMVWLQYTPIEPDGTIGTVRMGPGAEPVRGERRVNRILTGVRGFLTHAIRDGAAPKWVLGVLYELADTRGLPQEARGEGTGLAYRLKARHRLQEPVSAVDRTSDEQVVAMFRECRNARDRLIVLLLSRVGLRRGQVAGLRREDCHLLIDSRALGCTSEGAHLHVVRRENSNGAWSKSRRRWVQPLDFLVVQAFDQYVAERHERLGAGGSDFLLVNLFRAPLGSPVTPDAIGDLIEALAARAGLEGPVAPHRMRHGFASNVADAGGTLDEIQALLGQNHPASAQPYLHPAPTRLREAVERVASPRELTAEGTR
ncbi:tyrosine-type recombinase/integrase [Kitasatospora sp. NPDC001527]|uniref:tyrosine-type recombinase/integrase n=1 Tax=Kitasatospora sp. NPDC001527 TaxID=3154519 RepID=UPI003321A0C6